MRVKLALRAKLILRDTLTLRGTLTLRAKLTARVKLALRGGVALRAKSTPACQVGPEWLACGAWEPWQGGLRTYEKPRLCCTRRPVFIVKCKETRRCAA